MAITNISLTDTFLFWFNRTNELVDLVNAQLDSTVLATLNTTEQGTLVGAINEVISEKLDLTGGTLSGAITVQDDSTIEGDLTVGKNTGGDSIIKFYDDANDTLRDFKWDDSASKFVVEDSTGADQELVYLNQTYSFGTVSGTGTTISLKTGTTAENDAYTGTNGEITVDADLNSLRLHDGSTAGGVSIGGTAPVTSVYGRTGAVVAAISDYGSDQIDNDSTVTGTNVSDALEQLDSDISSVSSNVGALDSSDISNNSSVSGATVTDALDDLDSRADGGDWTYGSDVTLSGTSTTIITGIPSGVNEVEVLISDMQANASGALAIRLGDSGGFESSGYSSTGHAINEVDEGGLANSVRQANNTESTSQFPILTEGQLIPSDEGASGIVKLARRTGNTWNCSSGLGSHDSAEGNYWAFICYGDKTLTGALTQLLIRTPAGTLQGEATVRYR